jgi:hypothetical protein
MWTWDVVVVAVVAVVRTWSGEVAGKFTDEPLPVWTASKRLLADVFFFFEYMFEDGDGDHTMWPHLTRMVPTPPPVCVRVCVCVCVSLTTWSCPIEESGQLQAQQQPAAARQGQGGLLRTHRHPGQQQVRGHHLIIII